MNTAANKKRGKQDVVRDWSPLAVVQPDMNAFPNIMTVEVKQSKRKKKSAKRPKLNLVEMGTPQNGH